MHHRVRAILGTVAALLAPRIAGAQGADTEGADAADPPGPTVPAEAAPAPAAPAAPGHERRVPAPPRPIVIDNPMADLPPQALDPSERFSWQPFGFLRLQYRIVQNDPGVAFVGRGDGFGLQNARVGAYGALGSRVSYLIAIDGAVDERTQVNDPQGQLRVALRDAYVDVPVGGALMTRIGAFRTLVDPDLDATTQRVFVDRPLESRGVRATEGYQSEGLPPGRELGAALRLDPGAPEVGVRVGFELALQNGNDELVSSNDNDVPAVSASVFARLPRSSWIVASARYNRRTEGDLPALQDEHDLQGSVGVRIVAGPIGFNAGAMVVRTTFPTVDGPARDAFGAHGQLVVRTGGDALPLTVGYRFGVLDASSLILTDRVMEHTAGVVLGVPAYRVRVQLQATHVMDQRDLANDRIQLAAEVAL